MNVHYCKLVFMQAAIVGWERWHCHCRAHNGSNVLFWSTAIKQLCLT